MATFQFIARKMRDFLAFSLKFLLLNPRLEKTYVFKKFF